MKRWNVYICEQGALNITERYESTVRDKSLGAQNNFITHRVVVLSFVRVRQLGEIVSICTFRDSCPGQGKRLKATFLLRIQ